MTAGGTVINDCFIRVSEIGEALTAYIGSEECKIAQSCIDDSHSGFLSGIGMAGVVILSKCQKYVLRRYVSEGERDEGDGEPGEGCVAFDEGKESGVESDG